MPHKANTVTDTHLPLLFAAALEVIVAILLTTPTGYSSVAKPVCN